MRGVLPGFTVESDGNIIVRGEAESAKIISRNGSVTLQKGVGGKNDMVVSAKKEINLVFAQSTIISTEAILNIDKYCMHCDITCENVMGTQAHAAIIGGSLTAFSKVEIDIVGNDKGVETKISVVDKKKSHCRQDAGTACLKKKLEIEMEPIQKQLKSKAAILKAAGGQPSQRQSEELRKWLDAYNKLAAKLKYVLEKTGELDAELKKPRKYTGYIKVTGDIFPGTEINLYGMTKVIKSPLINKIFRIKDGSVAVEG